MTDMPPLPDSHRQILYVEDDPVNQSLVFLYLKNEPFHVTSAKSPEEALIKLNEARFDILMVDLSLQKKNDGAELVRKIRSLPQNHSLPIMVISGYELEEVEKMGIGNQIQFFFQKPIRKTELVNKLNQLFGIAPNRT